MTKILEETDIKVGLADRTIRPVDYLKSGMHDRAQESPMHKMCQLTMETNSLLKRISENGDASAGDMQSVMLNQKELMAGVIALMHQVVAMSQKKVDLEFTVKRGGDGRISSVKVKGER